MENILEQKRKERGLTQQDMADKIGVSRQYYNELENKKRQPSVTAAKKIAQILGLEWTIFFTK